MIDATYTTNGWFGFTIQFCNAQIIQGNRVLGQYKPYSEPRGMFFHYLNTDVVPAKIYNNEILLSKTGTSFSTRKICFF